MVSIKVQWQFKTLKFYKLVLQVSNVVGVRRKISMICTQAGSLEI